MDAPAVDRFGKPFSACVSPDVIVGATDVIRAQNTKDSRNGQDQLTITLSARGRLLLIQYTLGHVGDQIAVVIDRRTVSAPVIGQPILASWPDTDFDYRCAYLPA